MKRVYLQQSGQPIAFVSARRELCVDPVLVRTASVAIARFAVNGDVGRNAGDPVHDWVTENRRRENEWRRARGSPEVPYSSCADLGGWLLMMLGCREEEVINRSWDGGRLPWRVGMNIAKLIGSPWYVSKVGDAEPTTGDVVHVRGSVENSDHIAVLERFDAEAGVVESFDYGQPYGRRCVRAAQRRGSDIFFGSKLLRGWVDVTRVVYMEPAIVPDDFVGGIPSDNPYDEALHIPPNIL